MHYRHVGTHAEDTAEGVELAPGDSTESIKKFDATKPRNVQLIDDGILIPIEEEPKKGKEDK